MNQLRNQRGFSAVEGVIVVIVIVLIAALGYVAWNQFVNQSDQAATPTASEEAVVADDVPTAPQINDTSDLDEASATLDEVEVGGSEDSATLEREFESF